MRRTKWFKLKFAEAPSGYTDKTTGPSNSENSETTKKSVENEKFFFFGGTLTRLSLVFIFCFWLELGVLDVGETGKKSFSSSSPNVIEGEAAIAFFGDSSFRPYDLNCTFELPKTELEKFNRWNGVSRRISLK